VQHSLALWEDLASHWEGGQGAGRGRQALLELLPAALADLTAQRQAAGVEVQQCDRAGVLRAAARGIDAC